MQMILCKFNERSVADSRLKTSCQQTHCSGHVKSSKQKQWLSHFLEVERHKCTWRQLRSSEDFIFDRRSTWLELLWQGFLSTLQQAFSLHLIFNQNLFDTFYSFYTFRSGVHDDPPKRNLASLDSIFVQTGFSSRSFLNQRDELFFYSKLSVDGEASIEFGFRCTTYALNH